MGQINMFSEIKNCVSSAKVSAVNNNAGGIVGNNNNKTTPAQSPVAIILKIR